MPMNFKQHIIKLDSKQSLSDPVATVVKYQTWNPQSNTHEYLYSVDLQHNHKSSKLDENIDIGKQGTDYHAMEHITKVLKLGDKTALQPLSIHSVHDERFVNRKTTENQISAVGAYTSSAYNTLNQALVGLYHDKDFRKTASDRTRKRWADITQHVSDYIDLNRVKQPTTVLTSFNGQFLRPVIKDHLDSRQNTDHVVIHAPRFTSTTTRPSILNTFHKWDDYEEHPTFQHYIDDKQSDPFSDKSTHRVAHVMNIKLPTNSRAASVYNHSAIMGEHEVLLDHGAKIKVHVEPKIVTYNIDRSPNTHHLFIWQGEMIGHEHPDHVKEVLRRSSAALPGLDISR